MELSYLRSKLKETLNAVLLSDKADQVDFWRNVAIFQNGFASPRAFNQRFRYDEELAKLKSKAFSRGEEQCFERGEIGMGWGSLCGKFSRPSVSILTTP